MEGSLDMKKMTAAFSGKPPPNPEDEMRKRHVGVTLELFKELGDVLAASDLMCPSSPEMSMDGADFLVTLKYRRQGPSRFWLAVKAPEDAGKHLELYPGVHVIVVDLTQDARAIDASVVDQLFQLLARPYGVC